MKMNFINNLFRLCVVYFFAAVIGCWMLVLAAVTMVWKGPSWFFKKVVRSARPKCMQDSSLGSHGFLRTRVSRNL